VKRTLVVILTLCLLAVATGAAGHLHEHEADASHDQQHCVIHATLSSPTITGGWVSLLVTLGLLVTFLIELPRVRPAQHSTFRIDCRGPPAGC
jgi:hypothetical protein